MTTADIVRAACVAAYNMDYKKFLETFEIPDDYYAKEKYAEMHKDFSLWFCSLDSKFSNKFMIHVLQNMDNGIDFRVRGEGNKTENLKEIVMISNSDNTVDSRDIIKRIEELQDELEGYEEEREDINSAIEECRSELQDEDHTKAQREHLLELIQEYQDDLENVGDLDEYDKEELETLKALAEEASQYCSDWNDGVTLINEDYFVEYTEQLAKDLCAVGGESDWIVIDWEATADNLKVDYSAIDWDGETFYVLNN